VLPFWLLLVQHVVLTLPATATDVTKEKYRGAVLEVLHSDSCKELLPPSGLPLTSSQSQLRLPLTRLTPSRACCSVMAGSASSCYWTLVSTPQLWACRECCRVGSDSGLGALALLSVPAKQHRYVTAFGALQCGCTTQRGRSHADDRGVVQCQLDVAGPSSAALWCCLCCR